MYYKLILTKAYAHKHQFSTKTIQVQHDECGRSKMHTMQLSPAMSSHIDTMNMALQLTDSKGRELLKMGNVMNSSSCYRTRSQYQSTSRKILSQITDISKVDDAQAVPVSPSGPCGAGGAGKCGCGLLLVHTSRCWRRARWWGAGGAVERRCRELDNPAPAHPAASSPCP